MNTLKDQSSSRKFKMVLNSYKSNDITTDVIHEVKPDADLGLLQHPRWSAL